MRQFFSSIKFKVFVVIACLLLGIMIYSAKMGGLSTFTQSVVSTVITPLQSASSKVSSAFSGFINNISSLGTMQKQNDDLKKQINDLHKQIVDYNNLKRENEKLKALANLQSDDNSRKYTDAEVISHDPGQWFSAFTIDKGTINGIHKNDPVITADGLLVGIVYDPSPTSSVVLTILDPTVHIGASISQTGDTGITCGDRELSSKGQFKLSHLAKDSSIINGDIVITNGYGGIFPKDLQIGTVQNIQVDVSGNSVNAICSPMIDPSSVKDVFVITDFYGKTTASGVSSYSSKSSSTGAK